MNESFSFRRTNIPIGVVKRLMDALKGESFSADVFPYFLEAFKVLVQCNMSGETARSLALFVTYALHDSRTFARRTLRSKSSVMRLRSRATPPSTTPGSTPRSASPIIDPSMAPGLSLADLGVAILNMLAELLCDEANITDIQRFAKNVTSKVRVTYLIVCLVFADLIASGFFIYLLKLILVW